MAFAYFPERSLDDLCFGVHLFVPHPSFIIHNSNVPVTASRKAAYSILLRVGAWRDFAVDLLQREDVSRLSDPDRRLTTEIVMGVLRWQGALDGEIESLSGKPLKYFDSEILTILRMAVYQIRFLTKIPARAAL